jgi:indolepyruvate ferredoxin oxidoreductase alpha subunit
MEKGPYPFLKKLYLKPQGDIKRALEGMGVRWIRVVNPYDVENSIRVIEEAYNSEYSGLKVIISDAECALEAGRKIRQLRGKAIERGKRWVERKLGVDEDICTGDHSCISYNGCPSLTVRNNPNPLKDDKIAWIDYSCIGCGLCSEIAHVARLCPSFYQVDRVINPSFWERLVFRVRTFIIERLL